MTRLMYDGIAADAHLIPTDAEIVAGYVDGLYAWSAANWARFPHSIKVRIAVFTDTDDGEVLDCEQGNNTPAGSVDWVLMRRRAGVDPTVYCGKNTWWSQIRADFQARGVPEPHYWVADYSGIRQIPAGAIALQYTDTGSYDLSVVADYWPGIDRPQQENDMTPDQEAQLLNWAENSYAALLLGGTSMGEVAPGEANNSVANTLDYLVKEVPQLAAGLTAVQKQLAAVAVPTISQEALNIAVANALTDPAVLKDLAHAGAVEVHNDTPSS